MVADSLRLIAYVEPDTTGIIGVPRSGMIPAAAIATHCHLPLYELTSTGPRQLSAGGRGRWTVIPPSPKFLLVDDSSHSGAAMQNARRILSGRNVTYAAVYALTRQSVDVCARVLDSPHVFDWNIFNNGQVIGQAIDPRLRGDGFAFDFDGILCAEPPWRHTDEKEADVKRWMESVRPSRWIPRLHPLRMVVSFRLERHRPIIEAWLKRWGVQVKELVLHPATSFAERDKAFDVIAHKAERFRLSGCAVFVESCPQQAEIIARHSGRIVFCPPARRVFQGQGASQ
jgi:hypothetical protein